MERWSEKSLALIERARGFSDDDDFLKLVQAQICITRERDDEAEWLLNSVAEDILDDADNNLEMYCYYLYIRTLQKRDASVTGQIFDSSVVRIKIRDKGVGIDNLDKAMTPLFTTGGDDRAGLGFTVMKSFCDNVRVSSQVGKGTTVTLTKRIVGRSKW